MYSSIILHHSGSRDHDWPDIETYDRWHKERGWRMVGYHKVIEKINGRYYALMGRPLWMIGSHCFGWNRSAIGVCFAGNFNELEMPEAQIEVGAQQISELCIQYGIAAERIWLHKDCGQTECPGSRFPKAEIWSEVRRMIQLREV